MEKTLIYKTQWKPESSGESGIKFILFLISPFLAFLYSLRSINTRSSFVVFFFTAVFFGLSMTYAPDNMLDGHWHAFDFQSYEFMSSNQYWQKVNSFFTFDNQEEIKDLYDVTVKYLVSRVTNNYHVFFMVLAIVFATFSLKGFKIFTSEQNLDRSLLTYILAYIFLTPQIFDINGVRFPTATVIATLCLFKIFRDKNYNYLWLAAITPLIHAGYVFFFAILGMGIFLKKLGNIWTILFVASFFTGELSLQLLGENLDMLSGFREGWAESYFTYNDVYYTKGSGFYWVREIFQFLGRFYWNFIVLLMLLNKQGILSNPKTRDLFRLLVIIMTFSNFTYAIPSLGSRYRMLCMPLIAYIWLVSFKGSKKDVFVLYVYPVVASLSLFDRYQQYMSVLDYSFFFSSPFLLIYQNLINYVPVAPMLR